MKLASLALASLVALSAALAAKAGERGMIGVANPQQAHQDYIMKCQGCHRPDGSGDDRSNPPIRGVLARFLTVPGGRAFIGRVPGVATVDLDDARLAELVNWTLQTFDAEHLPHDFRPYSAAEIAALRRTPLRLDRAAMRTRLVEGFSSTEAKQTQ
jgi:hypothetical protein